MIAFYRNAAIASGKVNDDQTTLLRRSYSVPVHRDGEAFDLVLFSYALSMFNPGWEQAIDAAYDDLAEDGVIAVVDFSHTRFSWFRRWMGVNHVRMALVADLAQCEQAVARLRTLV